MRTDILDRKEEILQWIKEEQPKRYIAAQLKCKPETLNHYLKVMNIEYAGQQSKKGQQKGPNIYKQASEYLGTNKRITSSMLKYKILRDGLKEYKCEKCGLSTWLDEEIPLELHHKNGNHYDNNFENLIILCPNCHALEENRQTKKDYDNKHQDIQYSYKEKINNQQQQKKEKKKNYCIDCGKEIKLTSTRCQECYHKFTRGIFTVPLNEMPVTRDELKQLIRTMPFTKIGEKFGISDNGIRKWCDKYNLPRKSSEIKKISDEEWKKI